MNHLLLASAGTIFYPADKDVALTSFLAKRCGGTLDEHWEVLQFELNQGGIQLVRKKSEPGNFVSRTKLGIYNFMQQNYGEAVREHPNYQRLASAKYSIGVIFEPDIVEDDDRVRFFAEVLTVSDGVVFNGESIFNPQLEVVTRS